MLEFSARSARATESWAHCKEGCRDKVVREWWRRLNVSIGLSSGFALRLRLVYPRPITPMNAVFEFGVCGLEKSAMDNSGGRSSPSPGSKHKCMTSFKIRIYQLG